MGAAEVAVAVAVLLAAVRSDISAEKKSDGDSRSIRDTTAVAVIATEPSGLLSLLVADAAGRLMAAELPVVPMAGEPVDVLGA
jgi:hypothetical protein